MGVVGYFFLWVVSGFVWGFSGGGERVGGFGFFLRGGVREAFLFGLVTLKTFVPLLSKLVVKESVGTISINYCLPQDNSIDTRTFFHVLRWMSESMKT